MKIKKLVALALASTMVFSTAACGGSKDDKKSASKANDVSVATVVEAFDEFFTEQDSNYTYDSIMAMKMEGMGESVTVKTKSTSASYDGVTYTKTTTKNIMPDATEEVVEESYDITKEDGSFVSATKTSEDEEWDVVEYESDDEDSEEIPELDVEALKKAAKIEYKGDDAIVTMEISADQVGMGTDELMGDMDGFSVKTIITYNSKNKAIANVEFVFDLESLNEVFGALGLKFSECSMKLENIKKTEKAIEIPAEIELD